MKTKHAKFGRFDYVSLMAKCGEVRNKDLRYHWSHRKFMLEWEYRNIFSIIHQSMYNKLYPESSSDEDDWGV